ncbi:MAG: hypothetical protein ACFNZ2_00045 [Prevotella histicola]
MIGSRRGVDCSADQRLSALRLSLVSCVRCGVLASGMFRQVCFTVSGLCRLTTIPVLCLTVLWHDSVMSDDPFGCLPGSLLESFRTVCPWVCEASENGGCSAADSREVRRIWRISGILCLERIAVLFILRTFAA